MIKKTIITAALLTFFSAGMLLSDTGGAVHAAETETASSSACKWKREYDGWTYTDESGKAVTNRWKKTNGKWYFFNKGGIMEKMRTKTVTILRRAARGITNRRLPAGEKIKPAG